MGVWRKTVLADTGENVDLATVDQRCTGGTPSETAQTNRIEWDIVKLLEAKRGFFQPPPS